MEYKKQSLIILAIVIIIAIGIYIYLSSSKENGLKNNYLGSEKTSEVNEKTYRSEISYHVPRGNESISVELTLSDKVIVDVAATHSHSNENSSAYMDAFDQEYKGKVIGKNINDINLDSVAGASITTNAFMQAIQDIQKQI